MNYNGPTVSMVHPSGSEGSPTVLHINSTTLKPVIQWSYTDETDLSKIQVQIFDGSTLIWDSYGVDLPQDESDAVMGDALLHLLSLRHFEIPGHDEIPFDREYSIKIRVMDSQEDPRWQKWGEWSDPTFFKVVLSPQASVISFETVDVFADHKTNKTSIFWEIGSLEGYAVSGYNILRSGAVAGSYTKINGSLLTDLFFETESGPYFYKIEVVMEDGSTVTSPGIDGQSITNIWMIGSFKFSGPTSFNKKRARLQSKRSTLKKKIVIQDKGFLPEEISLEIYLTDDSESTGSDKYDQLMTELEKLTPLVVRDPFGRSWTVAPGSFEDDQLLTGKLEYKVKFDLSEVSG